MTKNKTRRAPLSNGARNHTDPTEDTARIERRGNWEAGGGREGNEMALVAQRGLMTCDDDNDDDDDKMRTRGSGRG